MEPNEVKRKLTTIFSTDVQGYSRLMGEDEVATIRTLTAYREVISSQIEKHGGRVIDSPGDNLLAEFGSVVHAVQSAVDIQEELKEKNAALPESRRMEFRIGINVGDVVVEGERLYGDGVNIAARLEGLADGGGICISGGVYDQVHNKLSLGFDDMGEKEVKNIERPVRAYRLLTEAEAGSAATPVKAAGQNRRRWTAAAALAVLVLVLGGAAVWNFYLRPPPIEPASVKRMAFPLPEKPSIAVLPFSNLSGDPKQDYLGEGIAENIITALSQLPEMFVIARGSTFTYKGKAVKVQKVAEDLGVRYVLEGSVQKSGDRVRVTAQLIDAIKGNHIWAKSYDRELKDVFALQDDIT
ncbi:MAG: adenylate/guanylate cyclase domain-containing protein, partial [bacterium]